MKNLLLIIALICSTNEALAQTQVSHEQTAEKAIEIVRMTPKQSEADASHAYLVEILKLALEETEDTYIPAKIEFLNITYNQSLIFSLLNYDSMLDIAASGTTIEREINYRSARVPLYMGLLGYRVLAIREEDKAKFSKITSGEELKTMKACQGTFWPDAEIFKHNGYAVELHDDFETLYRKLKSGDCDYFPRGITEGYSEVDAFNESQASPEFAIHDDIMFYYKLPFMFYTSHQNFELADRIERGLEKALRNGKLLNLMKESPITKHVFPTSKWKGKNVIELDNPSQPKTMPTEPIYWINLRNI